MLYVLWISFIFVLLFLGIFLFVSESKKRERIRKMCDNVTVGNILYRKLREGVTSKVFVVVVKVVSTRRYFIGVVYNDSSDIIWKRKEDFYLEYLEWSNILVDKDINEKTLMAALQSYLELQDKYYTYTLYNQGSKVKPG